MNNYGETSHKRVGWTLLYRGRGEACEKLSSSLVWRSCKISLLFVILCERWGPAPSGWGTGWPTETRHSPTCDTMPNLVVLDQTLRAAVQVWPLASRLSRSSSHRNRHGSIGYLWLPILVIHCNYDPTSYRFRDKQRFWSKIAFNVFNAPADDISLGILKWRWD